MEQQNMPEAVGTEFASDGGRTVEYLTPEMPGRTIAYLDYNTDKTRAAAVVIDPSTDKGRSYDYRPADKALGIITRHIAAFGYAMPAQNKQID